MSSVNVLFVAPVLEYPASSGPQISVENAIKALSKVSELHVISKVSKKNIGGDGAEIFYRSLVNKFVYAPSIRNSLNNRYLNKLQREVARIFDLDGGYVIKYYDENAIDVVWCDRGLEHSFELICAIKKKRPDIKVVNDTCAVYSRFILRALPYENDPVRRSDIEKKGAKKKNEEEKLINLADVTTAVSEVDAEYFRSIADDKSCVMNFSNSVDVDKYTDINNEKKITSPSIYLAGSFGPLWPMDHGARWFLSEVFPEVQKRVPGVHFYIAGKGSKETLNDIVSDDITIIGKAASLIPYICNVDVGIVPLWFESGTRFKILESGAASLPIVSTTLGAEGIEVTDGKDILIADDPESFSESLIKLLNEPEYAKKLGDNLNVLVREKYCIDSLAEEGRSIFKYLDL